jgi:glycosyltransferase involved in cell wall biosynthesis
MRASVIVPARDAVATLTECLQALHNQTIPPDEIIVVDDGSQDATAQMARDAGASVIALPVSGGAAAARNVGAAAASGDILLFTDADCAPVSGWAEALLAAFDDPATAGAKGTYCSRQPSLTARFVQLEYEARYDRTAHFETIDFIDTYSAAYRRDVFEALGGFDPSIIMVEDQEFSFRVAALGYRMVFVPEATVYHYHADDLIAYACKKARIAYWKMIILRRHPRAALRDSHTPQTLKVQIALIGLGLATGALGLITDRTLRRKFWALAGASAALFGFSAIPFMRKAARRDPELAAFALPMLIWRALWLGLGMVAGMIRYIIG